MAVNFQHPRQQCFDSNGVVAPGAKLYVYDPGTTTPRTVYSDDGLTTPITQPVTADAYGFLQQIFLQTGTYRAILKTSANVTIYDEDDIDPSLSTNAGALAIANGGTGATTAAGARSNLGVPATTVTDSLDTRLDTAEATLAAPILAAVQTQTYASSFTADHTVYESRLVTLTGNITFNAPTVTAGQKIRLYIVQDGTGGRTATWNSAYKWPAGTSGTLSTTASAVDVLEGHARSTSEIHVTSFKRQDVTVRVAVVEDQKTSGTEGGTFTSGADRTRDLNTEVSDPFGLVTIASNQVTITNAGTYRIRWTAPGFQCGEHQSFLYNATGSSEVKRGSVANSAANVSSVSDGETIVTIGSATAYEIRHRNSSTRSTDGFGGACGFGTEVYTRVIIEQLVS